jgi:hypothetical protein
MDRPKSNKHFNRVGLQEAGNDVRDGGWEDLLQVFKIGNGAQ